ncbi:hypothetical protein GGI35DRAFT_200170 [Trichoderma velutinum]
MPRWALRWAHMLPASHLNVACGRIHPSISASSRPRCRSRYAMLALLGDYRPFCLRPRSPSSFARAASATWFSCRTRLQHLPAYINSGLTNGEARTSPHPPALGSACASTCYLRDRECCAATPRFALCGRGSSGSTVSKQGGKLGKRSRET